VQNGKRCTPRAGAVVAGVHAARDAMCAQITPLMQSACKGMGQALSRPLASASTDDPRNPPPRSLVTRRPSTQPPRPAAFVSHPQRAHTRRRGQRWSCLGPPS
jgi:hypothetical protein